METTIRWYEKQSELQKMPEMTTQWRALLHCRLSCGWSWPVINPARAGFQDSASLEVFSRKNHDVFGACEFCVHNGGSIGNEMESEFHKKLHGNHVVIVSAKLGFYLVHSCAKPHHASRTQARWTPSLC